MEGATSAIGRRIGVSGERERLMDMDEAKQRSEQISGVSNVAYDLMAVMTNKLEGIAAMEEYKLDAEDAGDQQVVSLLNDLQRQETSDVDKIKGLLLQRLQ
jgi:hypothetical protein